MKKVLLPALLAITLGAGAQESHWSHNGLTGINASQTSFTNWSEGGENTVAANAYFNGSLNYKDNKISWTNDLNMNYGQNRTQETGWRKNIDNLNFASKFGRQASSTVYYAALFDLKTQLVDGYQYKNGKELISKFFTPAYINLSVGLDWKPQKSVAVYYSLVAGKLTITADTAFSKRYGVDEGKKTHCQLGSTFKASYNNTLLMNGKLTLKTTLDLFTAYDDSFGNIDVNWDMLLGLNLTKLITVTFQSTLKFDDDVKYMDKEKGLQPARVQFKDVIGMGLSYKF